ncbi:hypothetical protein HAX54_049616 [Datura stramonium]|uniref:Uncharacterized protein n=1 Tax=Datura stramonium TaxID=4076 RepID=A0ABS8SVH2_DATST|nr:hypothetical protein [Datura stramonium]
MTDPSDYFRWYWVHSRISIRNSNLQARGHERQHRLTRTIEENPNTFNEGRPIAHQFDAILMEYMTAAFLGTRLSFTPKYAPPEETKKSLKVSTRRRSR